MAPAPKKAAEPGQAFVPPTEQEQVEVDAIAYEQGRAAKRAAIAVEDCPHGGGALRDAWLKGYGAD